MNLNQKISEMKNKKEDLKKFISKEYISKSLKFFIDEIIFLEKNYNFSIKEQKEIIEDIFGFEINYQTYASFYNRNIRKKKESKKVENNEKDIKKDSSNDEPLKKSDDIIAENDDNSNDMFSNMEKLSIKTK